MNKTSTTRRQTKATEYRVRYTSDKLGTHEDKNGNYHFYCIAPTDWEKSKFLIHIESAGDYAHMRTTALVSPYKTKPMEIQTLGYTMLPDTLLAAIITDAIALFNH